jgi:hypothetical protein
MSSKCRITGQRHFIRDERHRALESQGHDRDFAHCFGTDSKSKRSYPSELYSSSSQTDEKIRWYDREDHTRFDVCADDHCQRYQGITRASTPRLWKPWSATSGLC